VLDEHREVARAAVLEGEGLVGDEVGGEQLAGALDRGQEEVELAAREVAVERGAGDAGALGDLLERQ